MVRRLSNPDPPFKKVLDPKYRRLTPAEARRFCKHISPNGLIALEGKTNVCVLESKEYPFMKKNGGIAYSKFKRTFERATRGTGRKQHEIPSRNVLFNFWVSNMAADDRLKPICGCKNCLNPSHMELV